MLLRRLEKARAGTLSTDSHPTPERMATETPPNLHERRNTGASSSSLGVSTNDEACPPKNAPFWTSQIDACKHAARTSHKVRRGWEDSGMTPYEVCMHRGYYKNPILPRYNSEPNVR